MHQNIDFFKKNFNSSKSEVPIAYTFKKINESEGISNSK